MPVQTQAGRVWWWSSSSPRKVARPAHPTAALPVDLAHDRPDVLPLAFHVSYGNRLGWRDPYSLDAATDRQGRYAALLPRNPVYTP
jgi:hypothetical protein